MEFPSSYPIVTWVVMGGLGCLSSLVFSLFAWRWITSGQQYSFSEPRSNWSFLGFCFMFASGLLCCGIAGPPGYALSSNPELISQDWIWRAALMANIFALLAWVLLLIGQSRVIKSYQKQLQQARNEHWEVAADRLADKSPNVLQQV